MFACRFGNDCSVPFEAVFGWKKVTRIVRSSCGVDVLPRLKWFSCGKIITLVQSCNSLVVTFLSLFEWFFSANNCLEPPQLPLELPQWQPFAPGAMTLASLFRRVRGTERCKGCKAGSQSGCVTVLVGPDCPLVGFPGKPKGPQGSKGFPPLRFSRDAKKWKLTTWRRVRI